MKFIKVTLDLTVEEILKHFETVEPVIKSRIYDLESTIEDITLNDGNIVVFMTPNPYQEFEYMKLYDSIGLKIKFHDLTEEALYNFYASVDADIMKARASEWHFDEFVKKFILLNSDTNVVLDKINLYGVNALTEEDKSFLK